ncbi:MAG: hypothetical protein AAB558_03080 [Patescibacteria group bacterium]
MFRFLFLDLLRPLRLFRARLLVPEAHAPSCTPRQDFYVQAQVQPDGRPKDPTRRDSFRATLGGFPLVLFALSAAAASTPGCVPGQSSSLAVTEVDSFTVGQTSQDGMTLELALMKRADSLGVQLRWHDSVAPDAVDCEQSIGGPRLVRWDYREGSSTDARHYLFEVYQEDGEPIGNEPQLTTVLRAGYTVVVLEVSSASSV